MSEAYTAGGRWSFAFAQGALINRMFKDGVEFYERPLISLTNMLSNGSFETDTAGWTGSLTLSRQALSSPHGEFGSWYGRNTGRVNGAHWFQRSAALAVTNGRRYYLRAQVAIATAGMGNVIQFLNSTTALDVPAITLSTVNEWQLYDAIWTANTSSLTLRVNHSGGSGNSDRTGWLDNIMMIDLTDAFGAGAEPPITLIRQLVVGGGGYWDGTKDV